MLTVKQGPPVGVGNATGAEPAPGPFSEADFALPDRRSGPPEASVSPVLPAPSPAGSTQPAGAASLLSVFVSVGLIAMASGLQSMLVSVRAGLEGLPEWAIGIMTSGYFLGFMGGAIWVPRLVARVGHIRAFSTLASVASAATLTHPVQIDLLTWSVLRGLTGFCMAGMFVVVESWLNSSTERSWRGRVLALYALTNMTTWSLSQLLINLADPGSFVLFTLVSVIMSFALVPVCVSQVRAPPMHEHQRLGVGRLLATSPLGAVGAFLAGVAVAGNQNLLPAYGAGTGLSTPMISVLLTVQGLGGMLSMWPLGWLSDRIDRRLVVLGAASVAAATAWLMATLGSHPDGNLLLGMMLILGIGMIPLYALSVAIVGDYLDHHEFLPAASTLTMLYGTGAALGPAVAGVVMTWFGPNALWIFVAVTLTGLVVFGVLRLPFRPTIPASLKEPFVPLPRTTPTVLPLDTRVPESDLQPTECPVAPSPSGQVGRPGHAA